MCSSRIFDKKPWSSSFEIVECPSNLTVGPDNRMEGDAANCARHAGRSSGIPPFERDSAPLVLLNSASYLLILDK